MNDAAQGMVRNRKPLSKPKAKLLAEDRPQLVFQDGRLRPAGLRRSRQGQVPHIPPNAILGIKRLVCHSTSIQP